MEENKALAKLTEALSKVQAIIQGAIKDSQNPYFHASYADLASVWDACRKPLTDNGLAIIQITRMIEGKLYLETILSHISGEAISGIYPINPMRQEKEKGWVASEDPQALGSALTYARRYALAAIVGVAPEDDDGEGAVGRGTDKSKFKKNQEREVGGQKKEGKEEALPPSPQTNQGLGQLDPEVSANYLIEVLKHMDGYENLYQLQNGYKKHFHEWSDNLILDDMEKVKAHKDELKKKFGEGKP